MRCTIWILAWCFVVGVIRDSIGPLSPEAAQPLISAVLPPCLFYSYDLKLCFAEIFMLVCIWNVYANTDTVIACVIAKTKNDRFGMSSKRGLFSAAVGKRLL